MVDSVEPVATLGGEVGAVQELPSKADLASDKKKRKKVKKAKVGCCSACSVVGTCVRAQEVMGQGSMGSSSSKAGISDTDVSRGVPNVYRLGHVAVADWRAAASKGCTPKFAGCMHGTTGCMHGSSYPQGNYSFSAAGWRLINCGMVSPERVPPRVQRQAPRLVAAGHSPRLQLGGGPRLSVATARRGIDGEIVTKRGLHEGSAMTVMSMKQ